MPAASVQFNGFVADTAETLSKLDEKPSFFARLYAKLHDAQRRRAEREVARFIEARGGRMTDDLERKIERHFV